MYQTNRDSGRNATAMILIGLGILFLIAQTFRLDFFGALWPAIVMLPGLAFLYFAVRGDKGAVGLAVPGAVITGTGVILFYQNITNHWESWAYVWSLYPVFVGLALTYIGRRTESEGQLKAGQGLIRWGLIAFVGLWIVFELLIFRGGSIFGNYLLPVVLIGAGLYLMLRRSTPEKVKIVYTEPEKPKPTNGHRPTPSEDLQAKIDEALAEPDEPKQN
jgi:hypothetical protein